MEIAKNLENYDKLVLYLRKIERFYVDFLYLIQFKSRNERDKFKNTFSELKQIFEPSYTDNKAYRILKVYFKSINSFNDIIIMDKYQQQIKNIEQEKRNLTARVNKFVEKREKLSNLTKEQFDIEYDQLSKIADKTKSQFVVKFLYNLTEEMIDFEKNHCLEELQQLNNCIIFCKSKLNPRSDELKYHSIHTRII